MATQVFPETGRPSLLDTLHWGLGVRLARAALTGLFWSQMKSSLCDGSHFISSQPAGATSAPAPSLTSHPPLGGGQSVFPACPHREHCWVAGAGLPTHPCPTRGGAQNWPLDPWHLGRSNIKAGIGELPPQMPSRPGSGSTRGVTDPSQSPAWVPGQSASGLAPP